MSRRGLLPLAVTVVVGVVGGYYTFQPAFEDRELQRIKEEEASDAANLGPDMIEIPTGQATGRPVTAVPLDDPSQSANTNRTDG